MGSRSAPNPLSPKIFARALGGREIQAPRPTNPWSPFGGGAMSSAQDPFYIVREEIQDSIDKLQSTFHRWEQTASNTGEYVHLTKDLLTSCESIEWQVDELEKTISVASRDPAYYGLDEVELSRRRNWTGSARNQVGTVRRAIEKGKSNSATSRYQDTSRTNLYSAKTMMTLFPQNQIDSINDGTDQAKHIPHESIGGQIIALLGQDADQCTDQSD